MTIRVTFIEELTGLSFTAQTEVKVDMARKSDESSDQADDPDDAS